MRGGSGLCRREVVSPMDMTAQVQPWEMLLWTRPREEGGSRGCRRGQVTVLPQRMSPPLTWPRGRPWGMSPRTTQDGCGHMVVKETVEGGRAEAFQYGKGHVAAVEDVASVEVAK